MSSRRSQTLPEVEICREFSDFEQVDGVSTDIFLEEYCYLYFSIFLQCAVQVEFNEIFADY